MNAIHRHRLTVTEARPRSQVTTLAREQLPDVPGKILVTALVTFPPRAYSAAHRHPGSVMTLVLTGTLRSQLSGGPPRNYSAGATLFEPAGAVHLFAENPSETHSAQLLAVFVTDDDSGPLVVPAARNE